MYEICKQASRRMFTLGVTSILFVLALLFICIISHFTIFTIVSIIITFSVAIFDFVQSAKFSKKAKAIKEKGELYYVAQNN